MITEIAPLVVVPGEEEAFEEAFAEAHQIIASMPGYLGLELQRCLESENRYTLIVRWVGLVVGLAVASVILVLRFRWLSSKEDRIKEFAAR